MPDTDHVSLERATELLKQILGTRSPELGARLKQRLNASLREQQLPQFDERSLGYKSFQVFLEKTQGGWLLVSPPVDGPGDISVSLRNSPASPGSPPPREPALTQFRNEVWQAFTNPDPSRKRFLHKATSQVLHYKVGEQSQEEASYCASPDHYVEIEFIDGPQQHKWMEEFLNAVPIVGDERKAYESLMATPYSSAMNAAFTRALGDKQEQWRGFRRSRLTAAISDWASKFSVPMQALLRDNARPEPIPSPNQTNRPTKHAVHARRDALALLELLSDQEIQSIVLPVLLSTMLLRSRV